MSAPRAAALQGTFADILEASQAIFPHNRQGAAALTVSFR